MLIYNDKFILTGGSSVVRGYWNAIDYPEKNGKGYWTKAQKEVSRLFADYLLATGKVNGSYAYFAYKDLLIVQSRIGSNDPPQRHIFATSLLKLLTDFPDKSFLIKTPFGREESIEIRCQIMKWITQLDDKIIANHRDQTGELIPVTKTIPANPKRLQFVK